MSPEEVTLKVERRLLVFQHIDCEHPGIFREFLGADGIPWDVVELDTGDSIPALENYAALWVMGGPMDVWEEDEHPWLVAEKAAIRRAVNDLSMPFMGICLGHQLLADALGGEVAKGEMPEVGVMDVELTDAGRRSPYFDGLPVTLSCLQWHSAEVHRAPAGAQILANSPLCGVQALAVGPNAFSAQFHVEITAATIDEWSAVPTYAESLQAALGVDGLEPFKRAANLRMAEFNAQARRLYDNWKAVAFGV
jgi:GMP synthase-like glutamine amidotransferase